jgi:hypothetical protein
VTRKLIRAALLAGAFTAGVPAVAVIVAPDYCSWLPSWWARMVGCPTCADDAFAPPGGGCSGAS